LISEKGHYRFGQVGHYYFGATDTTKTSIDSGSMRAGRLWGFCRRCGMTAAEVALRVVVLRMTLCDSAALKKTTLRSGIQQVLIVFANRLKKRIIVSKMFRVVSLLLELTILHDAKCIYNAFGRAPLNGEWFCRQAVRRNGSRLVSDGKGKDRWTFVRLSGSSIMDFCLRERRKGYRALRMKRAISLAV